MSSVEHVRIRKADLALRIASQRLSLGTQVSELRPLLRKADTGIRAVKALVTPWPWLGLAGALACARLFGASGGQAARGRTPGLAALLRRGLVAWRAWSWARQVLWADRRLTSQVRRHW